MSESNIPVTRPDLVRRMNKVLEPDGKQVLWDAFRRDYVMLDLGKQGKVVDIAELSLKMQVREPYETVVG
jgi:hypothetical protein